LVDGFTSRGRIGENRANGAPQEIEQLQTDVERLSNKRSEEFQLLVGKELQRAVDAAQADLKSITNNLAKLPKPRTVYAAAASFPPEGSFVPAGGVRPVFVLTRGDVKRLKSEAIPTGLPAVPGPQPDFALRQSEEEGVRRAALAQWITNPHNMLTRRSIVNRVWQYHFGKGLVETPNDFGRMGALPSHAELLDWLAFCVLETGGAFTEVHQLQ